MRNEIEIREHRDKLRAIVEASMGAGTEPPGASVGIVMGLDWALGEATTGENAFMLDKVRKTYDRIQATKRARRQ